MKEVMKEVDQLMVRKMAIPMEHHLVVKRPLLKEKMRANY